MTTVQTKQGFEVSTVLTIEGDFSSFSYNLKAENDQIIINGTKCEVTMVELDWHKENLELYINVPVFAEDADEAEKNAQTILDESNINTITLLDLDNNEGCIMDITEGHFTNPEYFN